MKKVYFANPLEILLPCPIASRGYPRPGECDTECMVHVQAVTEPLVATARCIVLEQVAVLLSEFSLSRVRNKHAALGVGGVRGGYLSELEIGPVRLLIAHELSDVRGECLKAIKVQDTQDGAVHARNEARVVVVYVRGTEVDGHKTHVEGPSDLLVDVVVAYTVGHNQLESVPARHRLAAFPPGPPRLSKRFARLRVEVRVDQVGRELCVL